MLEKVTKHRDGTIILQEDSLEKMEVEVTEVETSGDYNSTPVFIYYQWCKKCGICQAFCPTGVLGLRADGAPFVEHPEKCIHCGTCDRLCPDFAITGAKK